MKARRILLVSGLLTWLSAHALAQKTDVELITRTFKVDSAMWDLSPQPTPEPVTDQRPSILQQTLQIEFARAGIQFPENPFTATLLTDKAMFLNHRTRELIVRATRDDLDLIEKMLARMQKQPPLVELEVRFVETPSIEPPIPFRPLPGGFTNISVYTEKEFRESIQRYENTRGSDIITAPNVMTVSGRRARVGLEQAKPSIYQDPPKLPRDTSPDADPTPRNKRRLPFPPGFVPKEIVSRSVAN